ncbi:MAG TPA: sugar ABC transporter permease [Reyranella sp.]|jgi:multiple sugar transport system permease protein|nr:multiple sugar transport system permease protein [Rhodospirillaceae bacterium]MEA2808294.1 multiple sugar transport system permease protein [Rhodospirillaceae bacterium]
MSFSRQQHRFFAFCVAPSLAVLALITLLPALYLLATSFTQLSLTRPETQWDFSQPLESYRQLWSDSRLHNSVWVQIKLSFWTVLLQLLIGLLLALLLNVRSRLLEALRTVFLIPMVLPPIVVAIIWKVIYTPDISPMHGIFRSVGWNVPALITDPDWALTSIIIADTWEWFPFTMLMVLAALQMMPQELLDAAKVDGASPWQLTRHITLPFIRGVLLVAGLFRLIDSIKAFPLIFILTDGGPGNLTEVTNYYSFLQAFNFSFLGFSSAITVALLAATIALSWLIVRMLGWGVKID